MLNDGQRKQLETLLVEMIIGFRAQFLRNHKGRPPLNYWEQIQNRVRSAARTTTTVSEWASAMQRGLQIEALDSWASRALVDLVAFCDEQDAHLECLDLLDRDHAMVLALVRVECEKRRDALREKVAPGNPPVARETMEDVARKYGLFEEDLKQ